MKEFLASSVTLAVLAVLFGVAGRRARRDHDRRVWREATDTF